MARPGRRDDCCPSFEEARVPVGRVAHDENGPEPIFRRVIVYPRDVRFCRRLGSCRRERFVDPADATGTSEAPFPLSSLVSERRNQWVFEGSGTCKSMAGRAGDSSWTWRKETSHSVLRPVEAQLDAGRRNATHRPTDRPLVIDRSIERPNLTSDQRRQAFCSRNIFLGGRRSRSGYGVIVRPGLVFRNGGARAVG